MNDKYDLDQQEQMVLIREERARRFKEHKAQEEAKELLAYLYAFNEFFGNYEFLKDKSVDIYASMETTNQYVKALIEIQPKVDELMKYWSDIESDRKQLIRSMQALVSNSGKPSSLGDSFEHDLTRFFNYLPLLQEKLNYVTSHRWPSIELLHNPLKVQNYKFQQSS